MANPQGATSVEVPQNYGRRLLHLLLAAQLSPRQKQLWSQVSNRRRSLILLRFFIILLRFFNRYDFLYEPGDGQWSVSEAEKLTGQLKKLARRFLKQFVVTTGSDFSSVGSSGLSPMATATVEMGLHMLLRKQLVTHLRVAFNNNEVVRAN